MWCVISLVAALVVQSNGNLSIGSSLSFRDAFKIYINTRIIPIIPDMPLTIIFSNNYVVNTGNRIPLCATTLPATYFWNGSPHLLYTIVAINLDFPQTSVGNGTQALHWLVVNIPSSYVEEGEVLSPYIAAVSYPGTGEHRYVTLVYKQQTRIRVTVDLIKRISAQIHNFSLPNFVEEFKLGNPIAGNFFRSTYPECKPNSGLVLGNGFTCVANKSRNSTQTE